MKYTTPAIDIRLEELNNDPEIVAKVMAEIRAGIVIQAGSRKLRAPVSFTVDTLTNGNRRVQATYELLDDAEVSGA